MSYPSFSVGEVLTAADMNAVGLWKVASGTLSLTTTATNVTGVFSSTYTNYRVLINITARSTTNRIDMKYINGTTPTSAAYYQGGIGGNWSADATLYYQRSNNDAQFFGSAGNSPLQISLDIYNPNVNTYTTHTGTVVSVDNGYNYTVGGMQNANNVFTGFQLYTTTGTATVKYQVFGYRD
jgi:hypothetical protein